MSQLYPDLLGIIFSFLDSKDCVHGCSEVNKEWRERVKRQKLFLHPKRHQLSTNSIDEHLLKLNETWHPSGLYLVHYYHGATQANSDDCRPSLCHEKFVGFWNPIYVLDISALSACTQLRELDLCTVDVFDISPLVSCTQLTKLRLSFTMIIDISPLSACTQLRELNLFKTGISGTSMLGYPTRLSISDISALSACTQLTSLTLSYASITDISPLAKCTQLTWLALSCVGTLVDISPLVACTKLTYLDLTLTGVTDWSTISDSCIVVKQCTL